MQHSRPNEFIALVAMLTATVAMSIDTMLPALGVMAKELAARHENDRHLIILLFFAGHGMGTLVFGILSDSIGRKPAIQWGLAIYVFACAICYFAGSFSVLIAGRLLQGFAAAAPRVVALAMVRDGAKGAEMARIMSYVMSVFMLVPVLAPAIGTLVLNYATWREIFLGFMVLAVISGTWLTLRQPETLAASEQRPFSLAALVDGALQVFRHPVSMGYTIAVGFVFAAFTIYLSTSQQIFMEQYQQGERFALWFGGLAIGIAASMIFNVRFVKVIGLRRISSMALYSFVTVWVIMLAASWTWSGHPPLPVLGVLLFLSFFFSGMTFGNFNAMAMEPMGHIAGMAASISGATSSLIAIGLGALASRQYDGTMYPISIAFVIYGVLAIAAMLWAEHGRAVKKTAL